MTILGPAVQVTVQPQRQLAAFSLSNRLAAAMAQRNLYYGWVVAGATFLVMLATAGAMGAPGVIIQPLEKEFGWSTAQISVDRKRTRLNSSHQCLSRMPSSA